MRRTWQRIRSVLGRARDLFPVTLLGLLVGAGSAWALFHYGLGRIDLLLLVIGIVGLGLVAVTFLITTLSALVLWLRLRKLVTEDALRLECGFPSRSGFVVGSPWFVPFLRIGWTWSEPKAHVRQIRRGLKLHEEVTPMRRALHERIVRRVEVSDSFGLTRITFPLVEKRDVRFHPAVGSLKQMQVVRSMSAGEDMPHPDGPAEGERMDMRHYVAGDPIKFILWKVFARTREMVVRAIGPVHQTVAYLVTGESDEPAAGAARVAVDTGALGGDWVLGADGCEEPAYNREGALEALARSSRTDPEEGGSGLAAFLREATPGGPGRALVFVPAKPGPWIDNVLKAARGLGRSGTRVEFVVCADGIDRREAKPRWRRAMLREREELDAREGVGAASSAELAEVCRRLGSVRGRLLVVDRVSGRVFNEAHQRALTGGEQAA